MSRRLSTLKARRVGLEGSPFLVATLSLSGLFVATSASAQTGSAQTDSLRPTYATLRLAECEAPWLDLPQVVHHLTIELREHGLTRADVRSDTEPLRVVIDLATCDEPTQAFLQLRHGSRELSQIADISDIASGNHPRALAILVGGLLTRFLAEEPVVIPASSPSSAPATAPAPRRPSRFALSGGAAVAHAFSDPNPRNWIWGGHIGLAVDLAPQFRLQTNLDFLGGRAVDPIGTLDVFVGLLEASIAWVIIDAPLTVELGLGPWAALVSAQAIPDNPSIQARTSFDLAFATALRARIGLPVGKWLVYAEAGPDLMIRGVELRADSRVPFSLVNLLAHVRVGFRFRPTTKARNRRGR